MKAPWIVFALLLQTSALSPVGPPVLFIWNVGQGQFATIVDGPHCLHFDAGGEKKPSRQILFQLCAESQNSLWISHWDWDHISWVSQLRFWLPNLCLGQGPLGQATTSKKRHFQDLAPCKFNPVPRTPRSLGGNELGKTSNARSHVWLYESVLLPGDSDIAQEKLWSSGIQKSPRLLILGHHGSRTSTGLELRKKLRFTTMAVASARKARYGHPHAQVVQNLKAMGIPTLRTEEWGHLRIQLR